MTNATPHGFLVQAAQPTSGTVTMTSPDSQADGHFYKVLFTLDAARVPVTDATSSGSYGALKLADLVEGAWVATACRQNYTAFAEGTLLTGGAGDAAFDIGVGSAAIAAAADGALTSTNDNIGAEINITLSGGTGTGTLVDALGTALDGTTTAVDIALNWSGTAATIDATDYIDVTGTIEVLMAKMGDD